MSVQLEYHLPVSIKAKFRPHVLFDSYIDKPYLPMIDRLRQEVNSAPGSKSDQELQKAADFIEKCVHLNVIGRASTVWLYYHDWIIEDIDTQDS
ncbi:hypothetical protein M422DRAFT_39854 [Sphaerobolus stellatus SS14]|uniref:Uncharacterized protein n=1 Tax=Sphaerobolus stellatus (strain SS14) TaxID=990650 RepID=A0A0C9T2I8_SPHS4|nr:hypothetical protein M422DRAFT_39854 [Sphaerobolus stellatus SS14]